MCAFPGAATNATLKDWPKELKDPLTSIELMSDSETEDEQPLAPAHASAGASSDASAAASSAASAAASAADDANDVDGDGVVESKAGGKAGGKAGVLAAKKPRERRIAVYPVRTDPLMLSAALIIFTRCYSACGVRMQSAEFCRSAESQPRRRRVPASMCFSCA